MTMFTSPRSLFRALLVASAGAIILTGSVALADPDHGRGRDRGYDRGHNYDRGHARGQWNNGHRNRHSNLVVNFNSRPYYYAPRPMGYRPVVFYTNSYPRYYPAYYPYRTLLTTPAAYQAFEYTQPNMPVALNEGYTLTPGQVTDQGNGRYCREYQSQVMVNNLLQDSYGQACRQPDGSWEIVS